MEVSEGGGKECIGQPAGNGTGNAGSFTSLVPHAVPLQSGFWLLNTKEVMPMRNWLSGKTEEGKEV